jgi:hypothetical protein
MIRCKEVTELVAGDALDGASWHLRMLVRMHLLMCRYCGRYAAQLKAIGRAARRAWTGNSEDLVRVKALERVLLDRVSGRITGN